MKKIVLLIGICIPFLNFTQVCNSTLLDDNFSSPQNWTTIGNGDVNIANGVINLNNPAGAIENRVIHELASIASDSYWSAKLDFHINAQNPAGNGQQAKLISLTAGTLDIGTFSNGDFIESNQDAISLIAASTEIDNNDINTCRLYIETMKNDVITQFLIDDIFLDSAIMDYYITLERISTDSVSLSVFSDPLRTIHLSGSPQKVLINPTITGLSHVQHGTHIAAWGTRKINATLDNVLICDNTGLLSISDIEKNINNISIFPNPVEDILMFKSDEKIHNGSVKIFDLNGKILSELNSFNGMNVEINVSNYEIGIYILEIESDTFNKKIKFLKD